MSKVTIGLLLAIIVLLGTNAYALALFIDRSVLLSYCGKESRAEERTLSGVNVMLRQSWSGRTRAALLDSLNATNDKLKDVPVLIQQEKDDVWFGTIHFHLSDGKVTDVN